MTDHAAGAPTDPPADRVRLAELRETPLDVTEVLAALEDDGAGGVNVFVGRVRDHDGGRDVSALEYAAHPTAADRLADVCARVCAAHPVHGVAAVHRVGNLTVGDAAVVAAAAAAHRDVAFAAARELIDTLKAEVPIWKHQVFADGDEEWVGSP